MQRQCILRTLRLIGLSWLAATMAAAQPTQLQRTNNFAIDVVVKPTADSNTALAVEWYAPAGLQNFEVTCRDQAGGDVRRFMISGKRSARLEQLDLSKDYWVEVAATDAAQQVVARSSPEQWLSATHRNLLASQNARTLAKSTAAPALNAALRTLDSNNFPFIFATVAIDTGGKPVGGLTTSNFTVQEDGRTQTEFFQVTPPNSSGGVRILDFIFVIDNSGSMLEEQQAVKNNVAAFVDSLAKRQIDFRLGLVRFGQALNNGQPIVINNGVMTGDVNTFKSWLNLLTIDGGTEPGIAAIFSAATSFGFRAGSQRHFLLITDEDSDGGSLSQTISTCQNNGVTVHAAVDCAFGTSQTDYCGPTSIRGATNGLLFNVIGPYQNILNALTTEIGNTYIVRYRTDNPACDGKQRQVRITINAFSQSTSVTGNYIPCAAPQIVRTPATINLSSSAQIAGVQLTIAATITDAAAPFVQSATVFYRTTGTTNYTALAMSLIGNDSYQAVIPSSAVVTPGLDYYISATDGQVTSTDPAVDPATAPYQIAILPNQPPQITHTPVTEANPGASVTISATVTDNTNRVSRADLYYREFGTLLFNTIAMVASGTQYTGAIPGSAVNTNGIEYYIRAVDDFGLAAIHGIHFIRVGTPPPPPPPTSCSTFSDDFENGTSNWLALTPTSWGINSLGGNQVFCLSVPNGVRDEYAVQRDAPWLNFDLTLKAKSDAPGNKNFFIIFGTTDFNNATNNGYYLQFALGAVKLYRSIASGSGEEIAAVNRDYVSDNLFHAIRIERTLPNIRVSVDGAVILEVNDGTYAIGSIGFGSFNSQACFDDVTISGTRGDASYYLEAFDDGNADGWQPLNPSRWQVGNESGSLRYFINTTNYEPPASTRLGELAVLANKTWGDFVFECNAKSPDAAANSPAADVCLVFGYQDFDSYYYANFNSSAGLTQLFRTHNGSNVLLDTHPLSTFTGGDAAYHALRVARTGSEIHAFFDGEEVLTASDSFFGAGLVGIGSYNDAAYFDNIAVTKACETAPQLINLTPTPFSFTPTTVIRGHLINLTGTVVNNGTLSTGTGFKINCYLSSSPSTPDLSLLLASFPMAALNAGQSFGFSANGTVPATVAPGQYYVWVSVDADNVIAENNETDNLLSANSQLTVTLPTTNAEIKPVTSSPQYPIGAEFVVDIVVTNVTNLFGVSFELNYTNTAYIDVVTPTSSNVLPGAFMGNDVVFAFNVDETSGKIGIGVSRKTGQGGVSGSGVVASIRFKSLASTPPNTQVVLTLASVGASDPTSAAIPLTASSHTVTLSGLIVWPGDTNNDKLVNQADVLPLGLHWNRTGSPRNRTTCEWSGQSAIPWSPEAATHADANGDGVVNQADVLCIGLNWGKTHAAPQAVADKSDQSMALSKTTAATISTTFSGNNNPGQEFEIEVIIDQATDLFGAAFELLYAPAALLDPQAIAAGSLLGNDVIIFPNLDKNAGKISIGVSRKAGQGGAKGNGAVAKIKMRVASQAVRGQAITLTLQNVAANDPAGQALSLSITPGSPVFVSVASQLNTTLPTAFMLHQNSPNPFNPATEIFYDLPEASAVRVEIFDMLGKHVRTLVNEHQVAGSYSVIWDSRDTNGQTVASGVYLYQLRAGNFSQTRRMALLR